MSSNTTLPPLKNPSVEELLARARALQPVLRERAAAAEAACRVPDETIADFQAAGFFRIVQPRRYGGMELSPRVFYQVQALVAQACMSSAWVLGVVGIHPWQLALLDDRVQKEVWGKDPATLVASTYMPVGKVERVEGGFRLSGRWSFSSGCEHCSWVFLGGMVPPAEDETDPHYRSFVVPMSDCRIDKTWDTLGLRATGSHDIVITDPVFVPEYRTHRTRDDSVAARPGLAVYDAPLYRLPFAQVFVRAVSTSLLGGLQGAIAVFRESAAQQVSRNFLGATARDPSAQMVVAEAVSAADAMQITMERNIDDMLGQLEQGSAVSVEQRLLYRFQSSQVAETCAFHVNRLLKSCGGTGVYRKHPLARYFLDIHTGRSHIANFADPVARNFGGFLCGLDNMDPTV